MAFSQIAAAFARGNIHYGWVVVAVTFLTLLVSAAAMGTPGVMIVPLEREFGWSDTQISSALALRILLFGLFGPFAAAFMNRFGVTSAGWSWASWPLARRQDNFCSSR
jgi:ACR3 family arsenite efflux pump ArsB